MDKNSKLEELDFCIEALKSVRKRINKDNFEKFDIKMKQDRPVTAIMSDSTISPVISDTSPKAVGFKITKPFSIKIEIKDHSEIGKILPQY